MGIQIDRTEILKQELIDCIKCGECKEYFFGVHGINIDNFKEYVLNRSEELYNKYNHIKTSDDIYISILTEGLRVPYDITTKTIHNLGLGENFKKDTLNYKFPGSNELYNILVAIPSYITIENKKYFVGDLSTSFDERRKIFLFTLLTVCILNKTIPKEYIYGSYKMTDYNDKTIHFHKNLSHISLLSECEQQLFFENLLKESGVNIEILEMILNEKIKPSVDKKTSLVRGYDEATLYNIISNTITRKRIFDKSNTSKELFKKRTKKKN